MTAADPRLAIHTIFTCKG